MKKYDYEKAKRFIQMNSDKIDSVSLGMKEDMWWTAETVYDGRMLHDLKDGLKIAGIDSSRWATPCMHIFYNDGAEQIKDCYKGESDQDKPDYFRLGEMSTDYQQYIDSIGTSLPNHVEN